MDEVLKTTFGTADGQIRINLKDPKEDLTEDEVIAVGEKIVELEVIDGVTSFDKAVIYRSETEDLYTKQA